MEILILALVILLAIVLLLVELFVTPGLSLAGVIATLCGLYAIYYAFAYMGVVAGILTTIITCVASGVAIYLFMNSKSLEKVSLKKTINSTVDRSAEEAIRVGDKGITTTRLALYGKAKLKEAIVEVKSSEGFVDEGTPIVVSNIINGTIEVVPEN